MRRSIIIAFPHKLSFILSGVGLSLGVHIGFFGVGINEIFLIFSAALSLFYMPPYGWCRINSFYRRHQILILMSLSLMIFASIGFFVGAMYTEDNRSIFQLIRFFLFLFIIFQLPLFYSVSDQGAPEDVLKLMFIGVLIASIINWLAFFGGAYSDPSLPGQNTIGQQVALFLPLLLYWSIVQNGLFKRFFVIGLVVFLVATSLFSWSKGSWVGIIISFALFPLMSGRKSVGTILLIACLVLAVAFQFSEIILKLIETEFSASEGSGSNQQRIATILSGIYIARDFPFGVGAAYEAVASRYISETGMLWIQPDPHNTLAHVASVGGFGALASYGLIYCAAIYALFRAKHLNKHFRWALAAILFNGFLLMQFSGAFFTQAFWWLILGAIFTLADRRLLQTSK